jgi:hypothetical protein
MLRNDVPSYVWRQNAPKIELFALNAASHLMINTKYVLSKWSSITSLLTFNILNE